MKSFSHEWEEIHSTRGWGEYPSEHVIRFVARNFYNKDREKIKILDFGCGGGSHTWYLAREGFDVYAFDGSPSAVKNTKNKLETEGLKADLRVADGVEIDYENEFFDAVIDNVTIYANTYSAIELMYKRCYEILKYGGKFLTSCITPQTDGYGTGKRIDEYTFYNPTEGCAKGDGIIHFFTEEDLRICLEKAGFKNIGIDRMFYTDNGMKVDMLIAIAEKYILSDK